MKAVATQLFLLVLLAACEPARQTDTTASKSPHRTDRDATEQDYSLCGGTTQKARIDEYFSQVALFLQAPDDKDLLRGLIAERVDIVRDGRVRTISASDLAQARPRLISVEDWAEISHRGEQGLSSAGWRGCFHSRGKAFFAVDMAGPLRLIAFNRDMPW